MSDVKTKSPDPHHDTYSKTVFGFWLFLLTDFVLFGTMFATYSVIGKSAVIAQSAMKLFDMKFAFMQTLLMLFSSFFAGLGGVAAHRKERNKTLLFFALTFLFAMLFMIFEFKDFARLIESGNSWKKNAMLSIFFSLLATHGLHVILGLLWIPVLLYPVYKHGFEHESLQRLTCLKLFFQFLNIVWIFIYTIVYFTHRGLV